MSLTSRREFLVKDKAFSMSGKKKIMDPQTKEEIGFFKSRALQMVKKYRLTDMNDQTIIVIAEKGLALRSTFNFYASAGGSGFDKGAHLGKLKKKFTLFKMKFWFEDAAGRKIYDFTGDFIDHSYQIEGQGGVLAEISKKFFAFTDTYGIRIANSVSDQDAMLLLSSVAALDVILDRRGK